MNPISSIHRCISSIAALSLCSALGCEAESNIDGEDSDASTGVDSDASEPDQEGSQANEGDVAIEPDVVAANWSLGWLEQNNTSATLSWDVNYPLPEEYEVCWKNASAGGRVCKANSFDVEVMWNSPGYSSSAGTMGVGLTGLVCGQSYKVRVKRSSTSYDTETFLMDCGCSDPCPSGGWYDGENCYMGSAPSGTQAFIWGGNYYYTPLGTNSCPLAGSYYDGANCFVMPVPGGVNPFISAGQHWYYSDCP